MTTETTANLGLYGLGTMGSALSLNILDRGFPLHVANRTAGRVPEFAVGAGALAARMTGHGSLVAMARTMPAPRAIILMVKAGAAVDEAIDALIPVLSPGDTIIDADNTDFHDTRNRTARVEGAGLAFLGMGVSGGEEGARHGPSIMAGGTPATYDGIRPVIEAIAARHKGSPCAAHLGPDGAGHFVKTVHNGIEYADMQLIAEVYGLLRHGSSMDPAAIGAVFAAWDRGPLRSYLTEITAKVLVAVDARTGLPAIDVIEDRAGQKGTGRWTVIEALSLGQSASVIEAGVGARSWSADKAARVAAEPVLEAERAKIDMSTEDLESALLAARIITMAQGMQLMTAASAHYNWSLDLARIAEIWRAGCIIRSALLDDIATALRGDLPQGHLVLAPAFATVLKARLPGLRRVAAAAIAGGHPVPGLTAALGWIDTLSMARGTTNLIQGQRDFFGRHGFDRVDDPEAAPASHHGPWWD